MKTAVIAASLMLLMACGESTPKTKEQIAQDSIQAVKDAEIKAAEEAAELADNAVKEKLKAKAARDWPNDFVTQEFWIDQQMECYQYMKQVPDSPVKKKAESDWPLDFMTQKFWYNQQLEAAQRLNDK